MQKEFTTQPPIFVSAADLDHRILHGLDAAEAVIDWSELERLMASIYGSKTGAQAIHCCHCYAACF